jgi:hypothetical protein
MVKCGFRIDIETCRKCGGAVRIIACIEEAVVIEKILTHLDQIPGHRRQQRRIARSCQPDVNLPGSHYRLFDPTGEKAGFQGASFARRVGFLHEFGIHFHPVVNRCRELTHLYAKNQ